jgi:hypothetical protein
LKPLPCAKRRWDENASWANCAEFISMQRLILILLL